MMLCVGCAAIVTALRQVPVGVWEEIQSESTLIKGLAFAMAVIQGCLVARQLFGSAGLTRWYPFGSIQVVNAIWFLVGRPLLTMDGSEPGLDDLCHCVGEVRAFSFHFGGQILLLALLCCWIVCLPACVCACVCMYVCACVHVCICVYVCLVRCV